MKPQKSLSMCLSDSVDDDDDDTRRIQECSGEQNQSNRFSYSLQSTLNH